MDVVLVGLPGCGKSAIGRRLAQRHQARFIDLDELIESRDGRPIPTIFADDGEAAFRALEREAVASLGPADVATEVARVIATGGGAVVDPRNRWLLYRGRFPVWLDTPPEVLAQRLRRSHNVRPLVQGRDPLGSLRQLAASRRRFYAPALQLNGVAQVNSILDTLSRRLPDGPSPATTVLCADTPIGRVEIGEGIAAGSVASALTRLEARRAILVSEPNAWQAVGRGIANALASEGWPVETVMLPSGEDAKRISVVEDACRELAQLRVDRRETLVAIGGGALTDTAGFVAAVYLRGIKIVNVSTTIVGQIDAAFGGKTAVDIPEGKNLIGAFHHPAALIADVATLASLPERERRAALGEVVKMGVVGDDRLLDLMETDGEAIARGVARGAESGAVAEMVERCLWPKVEVVLADEREAGNRMVLNLGHTIGHGIEAAAGYGGLLHGEAVAYGLRGVLAMAAAMGVTTDARANRVCRLLDSLRLAVAPAPVDADAVRTHMSTDKKVVNGRQNWVLPTESGVTIRSDVPAEVVEVGIAAALRGSAGAPEMAEAVAE